MSNFENLVNWIFKQWVDQLRMLDKFTSMTFIGELNWIYLLKAMLHNFYHGKLFLFNSLDAWKNINLIPHHTFLHTLVHEK